MVQKIVPTILGKYRPILIYGLLSLLILGPLLAPGYILTLDMVFVPHIAFPDAVTNAFLPRAILALLNTVVPSDVVQKLLLLATFLLTGLGMHRLSRYVASGRSPAHEWANYVAGTFYMINPFTYSRFMAGQYWVLVGYALLPFFARTWLTFLRKPSRKKVAVVAVWTVAISVVSLHTLGSIAVLVVVGLGATTWQTRQQLRQLKGVVLYGLAGLLMVIQASSYWLAPFMLGHGTAAQSAQNFTAVDRRAFATEGGTIIGQLANSARLQGFWVEGQGLYVLPQQRVPAWGLLFVLIWILVGLGVAQLWHGKQRFVVSVLGGSAIIGALLATSLVNDLLAHVPLLAGAREPHKFVGLVALAGACFVGQGLARLAQKYQKQYGYVGVYATATLALLVVFAVTAVMPWGFGSQLHARQYPRDWLVINQQLKADAGSHQTLFLPWHLYTEFPFSERIIANPAADFFDTPIISSNDPEYAGVQPTVPNATTQTMGQILSQASVRDDLAAQLAAHNVKYILLSNNYDAPDYGYLNRQKDLHLVANTDSLKLYRNEGIMD